MLTQIRAWRVSAVVAVAKPDSGLGLYLKLLLGPPTVVAGDVLAWRTSVITSSHKVTTYRSYRVMTAVGRARLGGALRGYS